VATIKDVAAMAGVSASTVSYALNGNRPISEVKKAAITEAMEKLHYRPHAVARSLASKRTRIIAILFPREDHGIGFSELELIMRAAVSTTSRGYHLVIWVLQTNDEEELYQLTHQALVDGVILMEVHTSDRRVALFKDWNIPFILLGRDSETPTESFIDVDFATTMMRCISYLKDLGHRRIAFVNQSAHSLKSGYGPVVRTHRAFEYCKANFDMDGREFFFESDPEYARDKTQTLLSKQSVPTAFIVMNDRALPGIIKAVEESGRRIGTDISLVTIVSAGSAVSYYLPALTAFEMDSQAMMEAAVDQLIAKLEGRYSELTTRLIPCVLREKNSAGKVLPEKTSNRRRKV
jgi:DNA-binding LacI/PurR family transcriptional regulator